MEKRPKAAGSAARKGKPQKTLREGEQVLGPGVVKRARRDPATAPAAGSETPEYTPSEQVFRRR